MIDSKTGLYNPPQVPCVKGKDLMCPIREKVDSHFCCSPSDCRLGRKSEVRSDKQEVV